MLLKNYLKEFEPIRNNTGIIAYEFKRGYSHKQDKLFYVMYHLCLTKLPYEIIDYYYKFIDDDCIIWFGLNITINNLKEVLK